MQPQSVVRISALDALCFHSAASIALQQHAEWCVHHLLCCCTIPSASSSLCLLACPCVQVVFEPCQPLVVDSFKSCEGLSRIAFLDGNTAVMLGKVVSVSHK